MDDTLQLVGYASHFDPNYEEVCSGSTGHARKY